LGSWTCWGVKKWNRWQAWKRRFCSEVHRTWPILGGWVLYAEHKTEDKMPGGHQHLATLCGPSSTQRQTQNLIMGPSPTTKTRLLSFDRTQSNVVNGLLNGHNTLKKHLMQEVWYRGRNLTPHSVWVWSPGFTQTCISGFLFPGPRGY
jgi:hypothetical protein